MSEPKSSRRAPATVSESLPSDGRRRRTHDSQRRIVDALLSLVEDGHASPSAELVAERAGVGLRSVFRHFSDMDNLYREITLILAARLEEVARRPFKAADWQGKLLEMVERRADAYERMAPFLAAGRANRLHSKVLREGHARFAAVLRAIVLEHLPPDVARDVSLVEAIDLLLSPETWQRLRQDQGLDAREAKAVLARLLRGIEPE